MRSSNLKSYLKGIFKNHNNKYLSPFLNEIDFPVKLTKAFQSLGSQKSRLSGRYTKEVLLRHISKQILIDPFNRGFLNY